MEEGWEQGNGGGELKKDGERGGEWRKERGEK